MKKSILFLLSGLCFVFAGCNWNTNSNIAETGTVTINLQSESDSSRTVSPVNGWEFPSESNGLSWEDWLIIFTDENDEMSFFGMSSTSTTSTTCTLQTGTYKVEVQGKGKVSGTTTAETVNLYGEAASVTVNGGENTNLSINIGLDKNGFGSLKYTISLKEVAFTDSSYTHDFFIRLIPESAFRTMSYKDVFDFSKQIPGLYEFFNEAKVPENKYRYVFDQENQTLTIISEDESIFSGFYRLFIMYTRENSANSAYSQPGTELSIEDNFIEIATSLQTAKKTDQIVRTRRNYYALSADSESLGNGLTASTGINLIELLTKISQDNYYSDNNIICNFNPDFKDSRFTAIVPKITKGNVTFTISETRGTSAGFIRNGQFEKNVLDVSFTDLKSFLRDMPSNTVDNPYEIKVTSGGTYTSGTLKTALTKQSDDTADYTPPYVHLDLSSSGITSFNTYELKGVTSLVGITTPDVLTSLADNAFQDCSNLKTVLLSENLTEISGWCFQNCTALEEIYIPAGIQHFGGSIFNGSGIKSIVFQGQLPSFDSTPFSGCDSLKTVTVPIGYDTTDLKSKLPENTIIEQEKVSVAELSAQLSMFATNTASTPYYLTISDSNPSFISLRSALSANTTKYVCLDLSGCTGLTEIENCSDDSTLIENLIKIDLPSTVTSIGTYALSCAGFESIVLPPNLQTLGNYALAGCSQIEELILPSKVNTIGDGCFSGCSKLMTITIPGSVESMGNSVFSSSGMSEVTFNGVPLPKFSTNTFADSTYLLSIRIPVGVSKKEVEKYFTKTIYQDSVSINTTSGSVTLASVLDNLPGGNSNNPYYIELLEELTDSSLLTLKNVLASSDNSNKYVYLNLSNCLMEDGVESLGASDSTIDNGVFSGLQNLTGIEIPSIVTGIAAYCFYNTGLTSITLPSTITTIGSNAFGSISGLSVINYEGTIEQWLSITTEWCNKGFLTSHADEIYIGGEKLVNLVVPTTITGIPSYSFNGYKGLKSISIESGVTSIGEAAFQGCSNIETVSFGSDLYYIGAYVFDNCKSVTSMTFGRTEKTESGVVLQIAADNTFQNFSSSCVFKVPTAVASDYQTVITAVLQGATIESY